LVSKIPEFATTVSPVIAWKQINPDCVNNTYGY
jgi:hypothetical protein